MEADKKTLVHKSYWGNRLVEIYDRGGYRYLYFNSRYLQSKMSLSSPGQLALPYTRYMMWTLFSNHTPGRILLIGLGAGSIVRYLHSALPDCIIDAVDHSQQVIELARGYFRLPEAEQVRIHCGDGADFLRSHSTHGQYDVILLDAFDEQGMADNIYSNAFFKVCRKALTPRGQLCCNLWSGKEKELQRINHDLSGTFPGQMTCPVPQRGNLINFSYPYRTDWRHFSNMNKRNRWLTERFGLDFRAMTDKLVSNNLGTAEKVLLRVLG